MRKDIKEIINFSKTLKVLMVEDNEEARMQTLKMLKNFFTHIDVGVDGVDGLEKFKNHHDNTGSFYDLIISDINMPNMDGITMGKHIIAQNPQQEIIVLSAFNDKQNQEASLTVGIKQYIHKPIELHALISVIESTVKTLQESRLIEA